MKNFKKFLFTFVCLFALGANVNATSYGIEINGTALDSEKTSIEAGDGTISYNETTKELTLNNATISANQNANGIIHITSGEAVKMVLVGTNTITNAGTSEGIQSNGNLTITGEGSLTINTSGQGIYMSAGNLIIDGAVLSITASNHDGISVNNNVTIKNNASLKSYGDVGIVAYGNLVIDNSTVDLAGKSTYYYGISDSTSSVTIQNLNKKVLQVDRNEITSTTSSVNPASVSSDTSIVNKRYVKISSLFDVTAEKDSNSNITLSKESAISGESVVATIKTTDGYKASSVLVNNVEKISELKDGKLTLVVTEDTKIKVITEKIEVKVDVPSIDTTKEVVVKEVTVGVKEDATIKENFENAIKAANLEVPVENAKVEVAVANQSKEEAPAKAVESITKLVKESTEKLESKAEMKIASFFDITLNVINTANNNNVGTLTELGEKITFDVAMPEDLTKIQDGFTRTYYVIRYHEGKAEILDTKVNGNILTFATDKFSTYAIAYQDVENAKPASEKVIENPKTGDNITTYFAASILALSGIAYTALNIYKRNYN